MTNEINHTHPIPDDEIDLIALAKTLWQARKFIIITIVIFMFAGVAIALLTPKEYTASTAVVPQISDSKSKLGGLSSLAAMAGFNLNDMTAGGAQLSPTVYPQIVKSVPFQLELMHTPFRFPGVKDSVSIYHFLTEIKEPDALELLKKYTISLPFTVLSAIKDKDAPMTSAPITSAPMTGDYIALNKEQEAVRKILDQQISLDVNSKEGYLTLSATSLDAGLAAQITQKALEMLQRYITTFKIEKASAQLKFIEERYKDNKTEFEAAQSALAAFRDKNKNITSARARTQEERLESQYQLAFDVYSGLAQQLEQARIQVKEDTPLFSVLKPVTVPLEDNASGATTMAIWTFLGAVVSIGWVFGREFLETIREKWNEEGS